MKNKGIFTAIVLITIGVLCLLHLYDVAHFSWWALLKLWPLLLIWIGIKCIPMEEKWKLIFKVLVLFLGIFLLFYFSNSNYYPHKRWHHFYKSDCEKTIVIKTVDDEIEEAEIEDVEECDLIVNINDDEVISSNHAKLNLSASAGKLTFAPGKDLFAIEKNETSQYFTTKVNKTSSNKKTNIVASISPLKNVSHSNPTLYYNVFLSKVPVWELALELNATSNEIDLSAFKVKELKIESNASSIDLKFGYLIEKVDVEIESNASSVKINIPKNMKCIINKDNTLSSMKVKGLKKQKDGSYLSDDQVETVGTIRIAVEANVSSVVVRKY
jgi:energy-coupling factor transporter transmembrane protein EcfT